MLKSTESDKVFKQRRAILPNVYSHKLAAEMTTKDTLF